MDTVGKTRQLSGPEEYFCRLIAYDGKQPTAAYRIVWKAKSAHDLGPRKLALPRIQQRIREMQAQAATDSAMHMARRRAGLAKIADAGTSKRALAKAGPGDAISAIREDAILAGERRTDGTQVNISAEISINQVLAHLRGGSEVGGSAGARPVEVAQVAGEETIAGSGVRKVGLGSGGRETAGDAHPGAVAVAPPLPAPVPCGPLGPVRVSAGAERDRPVGANLGAQADAWESDE